MWNIDNLCANTKAYTPKKEAYQDTLHYSAGFFKED